MKNCLIGGNAILWYNETALDLLVKTKMCTRSYASTVVSRACECSCQAFPHLKASNANSLCRSVKSPHQLPKSLAGAMGITNCESVLVQSLYLLYTIFSADTLIHRGKEDGGEGEGESQNIRQEGLQSW